MASASGSRYRGFISYSHRDTAIADRLHRAIERYRVPARLVGTAGAHGPVPARLYPIFRDRDELAAGSLGEQLREAIAGARCFVLICSPAAAQSRWVNEEVTHFLKVGDATRLLCLIVDGEPNATDPARECFPPAIRDAGLEPMAADWHADGEEAARLKLIAGLLGIGFEELRRRDLAARNRRLALLSAASLAGSLLMAVLTINAIQARNEAERSRQQGEELIGFMLGDLRGKLEPLGKLDILDAVGDKAMAYFERLDDGRDPGPRALAARAQALRQIGEVRFAQGQPAQAVDSLAAALSLQRELAQAQPDDDDLLFELGQTEFWVGYAAWKAGDYTRAERGLTAYRQISERLAARAPDNRRFAAEVIYALNNIGVLAFERGQHAEALPLFEASARRARALVGADAGHDALDVDLFGAVSWAGSTLIALGRIDEGLDRLAEHVERSRASVRAAPDDRRPQAALLVSLSALANESLAAGRLAAALAAAREGVALGQELVASDPGNLEHLANLARHQHVLATALYRQQQPEAASELASARRLLRSVHRRDAERAWLAPALARTWTMLADLGWTRGDRRGVDAVIDEALAAYGEAEPDAMVSAETIASVQLLALERAVRHRQPAAQADAHHTRLTALLTSGQDEDSSDGHGWRQQFRTIAALLRDPGHIPSHDRHGVDSPSAYRLRRFLARHCRCLPITGGRCTEAAPRVCATHRLVSLTAHPR